MPTWSASRGSPLILQLWLRRPSRCCTRHAPGWLVAATEPPQKNPPQLELGFVGDEEADQVCLNPAG